MDRPGAREVFGARSSRYVGSATHRDLDDAYTHWFLTIAAEQPA